jgi:hypothetical protein
MIGDTDHRFPHDMEIIQTMGKHCQQLKSYLIGSTSMVFARCFGAASDCIHIALASEGAAATWATLSISIAHEWQTSTLEIKQWLARSAYAVEPRAPFS